MAERRKNQWVPDAIAELGRTARWLIFAYFAVEALKVIPKIASELKREPSWQDVIIGAFLIISGQNGIQIFRSIKGYFSKRKRPNRKPRLPGGPT